MNILGYEYSLTEEGDVDRIGAYGRFHPTSQVLQVAEGLAPQLRESTVLHEALEAINYHLALGFEHKVTMALEAALYQVLTSNGVDLSPITHELQNIGIPRCARFMCLSGCDGFTRHVFIEDGWYCAECKNNIPEEE